MAHGIRIQPGAKVRFSEINPESDAGLSKEEGLAIIREKGARLAELQELMFAAGKHSLLVVFQGRDTAGKDGAINRVLEFTNVQSTRVVGFKVPTEEELSHDFLWRVHAKTPGKGGITLFNRSHYEDVLVVRVHEIVPEAVWRPRYDQINAFESLLTSNQTILVKLCLQISIEEQEKRLLEREKDPLKSWKLSVGDWKEREFWDDYTKAYEEALERCSKPGAEWIIVPANKKWYRDVCVLGALVDALEPFEKGWREALEKLGEKRKAELAEFRAAVKPSS